MIDWEWFDKSLEDESQKSIRCDIILMKVESLPSRNGFVRQFLIKHHRLHILITSRSARYWTISRGADEDIDVQSSQHELLNDHDILLMGFSDKQIDEWEELKTELDHNFNETPINAPCSQQPFTDEQEQIFFSSSSPFKTTLRRVTPRRWVVWPFNWYVHRFYHVLRE